MRRVEVWPLTVGILAACCLLGASAANAGEKSDRNKAACKAWCSEHADEGCHHCYATSACGAGYSDMKKFGDVVGTWYACRLNDFGKRGEKNHEECEDWCKGNPECVGCTSTACGKGIKLLKMFTGSGKDWYACQKTDWAEHSEQAHDEATRWCADYTRQTSEQCRIVKSGKSCPDGFYKSDRQQVTWGRDYWVCLQSKSGEQRIRDCSATATANIEKALDFINDHYDTIADYRMQPNAYRNRRAHDRLDRKFPHVTVQCEDHRESCKPEPGSNVVKGGWSASARWVNLCYNNVATFCRLVGIIVHESGHNAWMEMDTSQHFGDPGAMNDRVYNFGYRAEDLCTGRDEHHTGVVPAGSTSHDFDLR